MSKSTLKTVIFSVITGILVAACLVSAISTAINQSAPLWSCIIVAVACVGLLVVDAIFIGIQIRDDKATTDPVKDEEKTPTPAPAPEYLVEFKEEEVVKEEKKEKTSTPKKKKTSTTKKTTKKAPKKNG